ncbi:MAG: NADH-quinone oxidoreductase subunit L [Bacilli bacterium]
MMAYAWLIPLFPLVSFLVLLAGRKVWGKQSSLVGSAFVFVSFVLSLLVLFDRLGGTTYTKSMTWLTIGETPIRFGFETNALNVTMLVVVSLVSLLVHLYSRSYMHDEARITTFYAYLGIFTFAMLALVLSTSLVQLYFFWELVGLGSFLLIGFYFNKEEAKKAAKKAFMMTRIGDIGFLLGILLIFKTTGTFEFSEIFASVADGTLSGSTLTTAAILIFIGAVGKSGQFPLHTWLPDAMEGPTPVSALIHAATMVAAGVYMIGALYPLFEASATAMSVIAVIGAFTAIFAASIGLTQTDIKRVLAYSTVSQLGFMVMALGVGGYVAALFHLVTHAFFKALLFLGSGSVIHATGTQNIEEMGGLRKKLPFTTPLFLIGTLAITGMPFFSGFYSKDAILASALDHGHTVLFIIALVAAFFTAFYMFRLFFLVFAGETRTPGMKVHESDAWMLVPMGVLAVLSVVAGYFGSSFEHFLAGDAPWMQPMHHEGILVPALATSVFLLGLGLSYVIYVRGAIKRENVARSFGVLYDWSFNKYYVDELYNMTFVKGTALVGDAIGVVEKVVVGGAEAAVRGLVDSVRVVLVRLQSGNVQRYAIVSTVLIAVILIMVYWIGGSF